MGGGAKAIEEGRNTDGRRRKKGEERREERVKGWEGNGEGEEDH